MTKIITRADALAFGLRRFFTGKPCRKGHVVERRASDARCIQCRRDNKNASESQRASSRDAWRRHDARKRGYAPPPRERDCPPRPTDGLCQCCHKPASRFEMHHNHETGEFIAWTCKGCNGRLSEHRIDDFGRPLHRPRRRRES